MKLFLLIMFVFWTSFSQNNIVVAGGDIKNLSYTVGNDLVELQIPINKEIVLDIPKFEILKEQPKPIAVKKKNWLEKLILIIKNLFK